jgi:spore coat protein U-like protein
MSQPQLFTVLGGTASAALFLIAQSATAQTAVSNVGVSATVPKTCNMSATPLDFGDINPLNTQSVFASGSLIISCTNGLGYTLSGFGSTGLRNMVSGTKQLPYGVYQDLPTTIPFVDGKTGTGSETAQTIAVHARVSKAQYTGALEGTYTDTIVVTLTY